MQYLYSLKRLCRQRYHVILLECADANKNKQKDFRKWQNESTSNEA